MDAARAVLAPLSPVSRAVGDRDRAEVLTAAGRASDAIRALEAAASAYGDHGLRNFQAECELTLSRTLLREDPSRARRWPGGQHAGSGPRAARSRRCARTPWRPSLRSPRAPTSLALLRRADDLVVALKAHHHRRDAAILQLQTARLALHRGDLEDARARIDKVRVDEDSPVATRLLWREVRSELARARGDHRHARLHVRAGLADLHAWQSSFGSLDLQSTLVGHGRALAMQGLRLALEDGSPGHGATSGPSVPERSSVG